MKPNKDILIVVCDKKIQPVNEAKIYCWQMFNYEPFVKITKSGEKFSLFMELPGAANSLDQVGAEAMRELCINHGCQNKNMNYEKVRFEGVPINIMNEFANEVLAIALNWLSRHPRSNQTLIS